jgi:hypothetical protein
MHPSARQTWTFGFLYPQQIIWNKGRTVLTRTHYWYQHEPCWYVRKKNAPWFGKAGENSTVWDSASPKFIMGGSDEEKFDHPTQKGREVDRHRAEYTSDVDETTRVPDGLQGGSPGWVPPIHCATPTGHLSSRNYFAEDNDRSEHPGIRQGASRGSAAGRREDSQSVGRRRCGDARTEWNSVTGVWRRPTETPKHRFQTGISCASGKG